MNTHIHEHEWVHSNWRAVEDQRYKCERCIECGDRREIPVPPGFTTVPGFVATPKVETPVEQLNRLLAERDSRASATFENISKLGEGFRNQNPEPEVPLDNPAVHYAMSAVFKHVEAVAADPSKTPEQLRELIGGLVSEFTNTLSAILRKSDQ